jgi:hypothetical protein
VYEQYISTYIEISYNILTINFVTEKRKKKKKKEEEEIEI